MKNIKASTITFSILIALAANVSAAPPSGYCNVTVCNKLQRLTLSPWKMMKDSMGEQCMPALLAKDDAVIGKTLNSSTRFYQGSFNPTKRSVTKVKRVGQCSK